MSSVLITGAARGIGYHLCKVALAVGHKVYGSVRSIEDADRLYSEFRGNFTPLIFDIRDYAAVADEIAGVEHLDILINNAGIIGSDDINTVAASVGAFSQVFEINTIAPLNMVQAVLPKLMQSSGPAILSISSQMSWMGYAKSDHISYRASKSALNKIMQGLAADLMPENIPTCVVDPGWVRTEMGGEDADNHPADVALGVWNIVANLDMSKSGKFIRWTGEEREY